MAYSRDSFIRDSRDRLERDKRETRERQERDKRGTKERHERDWLKIMPKLS